MKKHFGKFIAIIVLTFTFNSHLSAQNTAADLSYVVKIDASADQIWEQVRKMDNIDKISSFVGKLQWIGPKGVGGTRICTSPNGKGKFKEKILKFDDQQRSYTWQVVEGIPAKNVINSFKIVDLGLNKSMLVWTSNYEFIQNPNMTEDQFRGFLHSAVSEMVENMSNMIK
jgi:hypothetical protein